MKPTKTAANSIWTRMAVSPNTFHHLTLHAWPLAESERAMELIHIYSHALNLRHARKYIKKMCKSECHLTKIAFEWLRRWCCCRCCCCFSLLLRKNHTIKGLWFAVRNDWIIKIDESCQSDEKAFGFLLNRDFCRCIWLAYEH